jgi:hypothetical protein
LVAITKELLGLSKDEQRSENIFKYLYFIGRDIHIMWIRVVYKPLMQASVESGHFCTVGILFLDKFFWEISGCVVKKTGGRCHSFQTQMGQGFLRSDRPGVLIYRRF